jgi:predicted metal-dependent peptidase
MTDDAVELLVRASLVRLRTRVPFFGTLALYARFVPTTTIPTAATDGRDVFYNPDFFAGLPSAQLDGVIVHEVLHAALDHVHRRARRDPQRWNQAADIVVNGLIVGNGLELPEGGLRDGSLEHLSVEEVYTVLMRDERDLANPEPDLLDGRPAGVPGGDDGERDGDRADRPGRPSRDRQQARRWAAAIDRAITVARGRDAGALPAGIERAFDLADRPKLDWRTILWRFLTRMPTDFAAFDRRQIHRGLYLETLESVGVVVAVAIDTSGSIGDAELALFRAELDGLLRAYPSTRALLVYADAEAHGPYPIEPGDELPPPVGGGGTDFRPFFTLLDDEGLIDERTVAVYLTDGFGSFPDEPPDIEVLWVVTPGGLDDDKFPFGQIARMVD